MKDVIEIFFGLAVGLPLAIIGLIGLFAVMLASVASGFTLLPRGRIGQSVGVFLIVGLVLLMAFDVIPAGRLAGVPLLFVSGTMTFVTHQRMARMPEARRSDIPVAVMAIAGMVALGVPIFILLASGITG